MQPISNSSIVHHAEALYSPYWDMFRFGNLFPFLFFLKITTHYTKEAQVSWRPPHYTKEAHMYPEDHHTLHQRSPYVSWRPPHYTKEAHVSWRPPHITPKKPTSPEDHHITPKKPTCLLKTTTHYTKEAHMSPEESDIFHPQDGHNSTLQEAHRGPMTPYTPLHIYIHNIDLIPATPLNIFRLLLISMNSFYPLNICQPPIPSTHSYCTP